MTSQRRCEEEFRVRVSGPFACFTRPEFKVERVSYPVMTPSAARGVLDAIHWKPAIRWRVTAITVLAPILFINIRRNELSARATVAAALRGLRGEPVDPYFINDDRQQRNTLALRDVDYAIECHFVATDRWGPGDSMAKHCEMFRRRLAHGQVHHAPYLGCREFAAAVEPLEAVPPSRLPPAERERDLGLLLHDIEFGPTPIPRFFPARIDRNGRVAVPNWSQGADQTGGQA